MSDTEMTNGMLSAMNVVNKNIEYFMETSEFEIEIQNKNGVMLNIKNVFAEDIDMATQCLKLVHNISMLNCFYLSVAKDNYKTLNYNFAAESRFYLKISVSPENVNIDKRKGFGLFTYDVDDMVATLGEIPSSIVMYLIQIIKTNKKRDDLKRVEKFVEQILCGLEPNAAMALFVNENKDLYKKYLLN